MSNIFLTAGLHLVFISGLPLANFLGSLIGIIPLPPFPPPPPPNLKNIVEKVYQLRMRICSSIDHLRSCNLSIFRFYYLLHLTTLWPGLNINCKDRKHMFENRFLSCTDGMAWSLHHCDDHKYRSSSRNICNRYAENFASLSQTCSSIITTIWRPGFNCSARLCSELLKPFSQFKSWDKTKVGSLSQPPLKCLSSVFKISVRPNCSFDSQSWVPNHVPNKQSNFVPD